MYITPIDILNSTQGGLDIILSYYPEAAQCIENHNKKFRARANEKTPSASLKRLDDGTYLVTDFGSDQKPRNAIEIVRLEENVDFKGAINLIASRYQIKTNAPVPYTARFEERQKRDDEAQGPHWDVKESFSEADIREIFSRKVIDFYKEAWKDKWMEKLQEVCKRYGVASLANYTWVKETKAYTTYSDDQYPLFLIDYGTYQKIYQPRQHDKSKRFFYAGKKDPNHMGGYPQCLKAYNDLTDSDDDSSEETPDPAKRKKLDHIIICSGERDSLNVAALGYAVVWLNSETATFSKDQFMSVARLTKDVFVLPDIDDTGRKAAHELGMRYLDVKHIQLPDQLQDHHDWRGRPCKDVRDYLNHFTKKNFDDLVKTAIPYRSWDMVPEYDKSGKFKGYRYVINNVQLYNFLNKSGFSRIEKENEKTGFALVKVDGSIVTEQNDFQVRDYMHRFLRDRHMDIDLRNAFYRSNQISEASLNNLPVKSIDFTDFDKSSQWMFFRNKTWKITAEGIDEYRPGEVHRYVWENELLPWNVKLLDPLFRIQQEGSNYTVEILNDKCEMLRFLENTSRVHWKKEKEGSLTDQERREHHQHLVNKIFVIGYMLHRYKNPDKPWATFAMDNKISDISESHGGSGKSIFMKSFRYFMQSITLNGRDRDLTSNKHLFENVTKHTDYVLIDECSPHFDFNFFYSYITGEWVINGKFQKQFEIPYEEAPKIGISSNYSLVNPDPSTLRRIMYCVFSDYYHHGPNDEYESSWSPREEFGHNLFADFDQEQWNLTANLYAQCVQFYLSCAQKINPPMSSIELRELKTTMGENFKNWADVYFSAESDRLNTILDRHTLAEDYIKSTGQHKTTPNSFKKKMHAWCRFYGYDLNPAELSDRDGRIIKKEDGQTREKFYIRTIDKINHHDTNNDRPF